MKTFKDYIDEQMIKWLQTNNLKYSITSVNLDKGALNLIYNDNICLKIYDRCGHGYGVSVGVTNKYDESIYDNDVFNLGSVFSFFKLRETAAFTNRTEKTYEINLPKLIDDLRNIIPRLNNISPKEWNNMVDWIKQDAYKRWTS